jgi:hypothetical protein
MGRVTRRKVQREDCVNPALLQIESTLAEALLFSLHAVRKSTVSG